MSTRTDTCLSLDAFALLRKAISLVELPPWASGQVVNDFVVPGIHKLLSAYRFTCVRLKSMGVSGNAA